MSKKSSKLKHHSSSNDKLIKTLQDEVHIFETLYLKEQTKSSWLIGSTAILSIALVLALLMSPFSSEESAEDIASTANTAAQQLPFGGGGFPGGLSGGGPSIDIPGLFLSDGSIDTSQLTILENIPAQLKPTLLNQVDSQIDDALRAGEITESQAIALYEVLNDL